MRLDACLFSLGETLKCAEQQLEFLDVPEVQADASICQRKLVNLTKGKSPHVISATHLLLVHNRADIWMPTNVFVHR